ncbi:MAG: FkbM family methyltransferase [Acidimicrobiales bacterium]
MLTPLAPAAQWWSLRPAPTRAKAFAMRRIVLPKLMAQGKRFEKRLPSGIAFEGTTRDLLALLVYVFGVWEPNLTTFLDRRLTPGRGFIDVGANQGWFTLLAATLVGPQGCVVAVEASPTMAETLQARVGANGLANVRVIAAAAGSGPGTVVVEAGPSVHTGLTRVRSLGPGPTVPCDSLAALLSDEELRRCRVLKIDVEGAEYDVVAGLAPALSQLADDAEVVVEVGPQRAPQPADVERLLNTFADAGFHAYELPNSYSVEEYLERRIPEELRRLERPLTSETDVVFSRIDTPTLPL